MTEKKKEEYGNPVKKYTIDLTIGQAHALSLLGYKPTELTTDKDANPPEEATPKKKKIKLDKDIIDEYLEFLKKSMGTVKDKTFPTPSTPWPDYPWTVLVYDGAPSGRIFF